MDEDERTHERMNRIENNQKELQGNIHDTLMTLNKTLSSLDERVAHNDDKTDELSEQVSNLTQEIQEYQNALELHEADCPAREYHELKRKGIIDGGKETIKKHPWLTGGAISGIATAAAKLIQMVF